MTTNAVLIPAPRATSPAQADITLYSGSRNTKWNYIPQYSIDVSNLRDPGARSDFRNTNGIDGRNAAVRQFLVSDPRVLDVIETIHHIAWWHLRAEREKWLDIIVFDYQGKWIAPGVVEEAADYLAASLESFKVCVQHREIP